MVEWSQYIIIVSNIKYSEDDKKIANGLSIID